MKVTASGVSKSHVYVDGLLLLVYQVKEDQLCSSTSTLLRFSRSSSYSFRHDLCDRAVLIVLQTSQQRPIKVKSADARISTTNCSDHQSRTHAVAGLV